MSTPLAAVILAHADPAHLRRLVGALADVPVFLHVDARVPAAGLRALTAGLPDRVHAVDRVRTALASWSLVRAELAGLRAALDRTSARHVAVLSGADYPLLGMPDLVAELAAWEGRSWLVGVPLPTPKWSTPRHPDGGLWRLRHRFLTLGDRVLHLRGVPLRWPLAREIPKGLTLRAGSHWKIYARDDARLLLDLVDRRPDLVSFWRTTLVPEECFAPSMLASFGGLPPCGAGAWFIDWAGSADGHHPPFLGDDAFARLAAARHAPPLTPDEAPAADGADPVARRKLFARKFSSASTAILDRIDAELRCHPVRPSLTRPSGQASGPRG